MAAKYIHTCYRILDPERSEDFYSGIHKYRTSTS